MKYIKHFENYIKDELNISFNIELTNLNDYLPFFPGLQKLIVHHCGLTELPELPSELVELIIHKNNLTELPELPEKLKKISCADNKLTKLPNLPDSLLYFDCSNNNLTDLPELPKSLVTFSCTNNNLTKLPNLPETLLGLSCSNNNLTELPELPEYLINISFNNCGITIFPKLPNSIINIQCSNNNWEYPISDDILKEYDLSFFNVYSDDVIKKIESYEFQKDFLTKFPEKYKDLIVFGFNKKIKEEFDWLFNASDMELM